MARIAVLHNTLDFQGGADVVCLSVCEALATDHSVTLFTISETPVEAVAARFDLDIAGISVWMPPGGRGLASVLSGLAPWTGPQLAFRTVLVNRYFQRHAADFDLAISTANEMALPAPSIQYVHFPQFHLDRTPTAEAGRLNGLWSRIAGPDPGNDDEGGETLQSDSTLVLANSEWTAGVVEEIYGVRPSVLHPPVDPIPDSVPWQEREQGIVTVGRIAPDKRLLEAIRVVDRLRDRDYDIHLHIAGSAPPAYRSYVGRVTEAARERPYVHLERDITRDRLLELLGSHRFGLNMKEDEHFGMAVAEYVAAGMLPFAPAGGGQQEILHGRSDRLFESVPEAVEYIAAAIDADDRPNLPRDRFSADRFRARIRQHVSQTID